MYESSRQIKLGTPPPVFSRDGPVGLCTSLERMVEPNQENVELKRETCYFYLSKWEGLNLLQIHLNKAKSQDLLDWMFPGQWSDL